MIRTHDLAARSGRVIVGDGGTGALECGATSAGPTREGE
jgi:hypothetical protein